MVRLEDLNLCEQDAQKLLKYKGRAFYIGKGTKRGPIRKITQVDRRIKKLRDEGKTHTIIAKMTRKHLNYVRYVLYCKLP